MAHKEEVADFITKEVTLIPNTATLDEIRKATFDSHVFKILISFLKKFVFTRFTTIRMKDCVLYSNQCFMI